MWSLSRLALSLILCIKWAKKQRSKPIIQREKEREWEREREVGELVRQNRAMLSKAHALRQQPLDGNIDEHGEIELLDIFIMEKGFPRLSPIEADI